MLNPNCSETVIRLKKKDIKNLGKEESRIYKSLLNNIFYSSEPVEGYSELRSDDIWEAHFYYQTIGNELLAFAYWLGLEFDTDEVWHCEDLLSKEEDELYDDISEYLSMMFTEFEDIMLYPNCSEWATELEIDISELNIQEKRILLELLDFNDKYINEDSILSEINSDELLELIEKLPFREKISW